MSLTTLILGIAFLLFAIIFIVPVLGNIDTVANQGLICAFIPQLCDNSENEAVEKENKIKAQEIGNTPNMGDTVCDLKVSVNGELDISSQNASELYFTIPFTENNLHVWVNDKIQNTPPITHEWKNCSTGTQFNFNLNSLIPLDISGFALGDSFTLRLEGTSQDGFIMVDGNGEIEWKKRIVVEDGSAITIPYAFSHDFVIPNIKADNYTLKLFAENKQLNDGYTHSFVEYKVFSP